jgi:hypothetical protein
MATKISNIINNFRGFFYRLSGLILDSQTADPDPLDGYGTSDASAVLFYRNDLNRLRYQDDAGNFHTVAVTDGTDFDYAEVGDLAAVGAAAAAGTSSEIPRADHVHALAADATMVATTADNNLTGGVEVVHKFVIADGATADVDFVLAEKFEILDVAVIKTGGAGQASNTIQLKTSGGTAITDAIATTGADKTVTRMGTLDDAANVIASGGTLRVTRTKAGADASAIVVVTGIRRA